MAAEVEVAIMAAGVAEMVVVGAAAGADSAVSSIGKMYASRSPELVGKPLG